MRSVRYLIGSNKAELIGYIHEDMSAVGGMYRTRPALIICPGGAYARLSIREEDPIAFPVFAHGYNVFILRYSVGDAIRSSAPEAEAAAAIEAIRHDSDKLLTDPDSIAILGFSAGGHVAASIACHWKRYGRASRPDAAVLCYPVISTGAFGHAESTGNITGGDSGLMEYYSLEKQVDDDTVPCFIWHTLTDASVDIRNAMMFASALIEHGVECELHVYPHGAHGLSLGYRETGEEEKCIQGWSDLMLSYLDGRWGFAR